MGIVPLIISIFATTAGNTAGKMSFRHSRMTSQLMLFIVAGVMFVVSGLYIIVVRPELPTLAVVSALLIVIISVISFIGNACDAISLKANDISLREPVTNFEPILAGFIAYLVFPNQRHIIYLIAFIVGAFITFWGVHRRKLRKYQKKGMIFMWTSVCLFAVLPTLYQMVLPYISPAYLTLFRTIIVFVLTYLLMRNIHQKKRHSVSNKSLRLAVVSGAFYATASIAGLYAITALGAVPALAFMMLGSGFTYLSGKFVLGEEVQFREILSSLLLAIIVGYATIVDCS